VEHDKVAIGKLDCEYFERDASLIRPQEEDEVRLGPRCLSRIERVRAVLDDVSRSVGADTVARR
jgi:hypothetical protein